MLTLTAVFLVAVLLLALPSSSIASPVNTTYDYTISGNAYANALHSGKWAGCDGSTANVKVVAVKSGVTTLVGSTTCDATSGAYSINLTDTVAWPAGSTLFDNRKLMVYVDGHATQRAAIYYGDSTGGSGCLPSGLDEICTYTWTGDLDGGSVRVRGVNASDMAFADYDWDTDIDLQITGSDITQGVASRNTKLEVITDFSAANATLDGMLIAGNQDVVFTGNVTLESGGATVSLCGLYGVTASTPICNNSGSTLQVDGTLTYTSATAIAPNSLALTVNGNVTFAPAATVTYTMAAPLTVAGNLTIGDGANALTFATGAYALNTSYVDATKIGSVFVRSPSLLTGTGDMTITGTFYGAGTVTRTGGTVHQRITGADRTFGTTFGAVNWTLNNLSIENSSGVARVVSRSNTGTGSTILTGNLTVGESSGSGITFDFAVNNRVLDVDGSVTIESTGTFKPPTSASFTVGGNWVNNGIFDSSGGGTVNFDAAANVVQQISGTTAASTANGDFQSVTKSGASRILQLATDLTVNGTMTLGSTSCDTPAKLWSSTVASARTVSVATTTFDAVDLSGITKAGVGAWTTGKGFQNGGHNTGLPAGYDLASCAESTISGTAYGDDADSTTYWANCNNDSANVAMYVEADRVRTTCDPTTGTFTVTHMLTSTDAVMTTWFDTNGGDTGVQYTRYTTPTAPTVKLNKGSVRFNTGTATNPTNAMTSGRDSTLDSDIPLTYSAGPMVVSASSQILVPTGVTFVPGNSVSAGAIDVRGTYTQAASVTDVLTAVGSNATCSANGVTVQLPLCVTGTFTAASTSTTNFTGSGSATSIQGLTYGALSIKPTSNTTYQLGAGASNTITTSGAGQNATATFEIGDGTNPVIVSNATYNAVLNVAATVDKRSIEVAAGATLSGAGTGQFTVAGGISGAGSVNLTGNSVVMNADTSVAVNRGFGPTGSNDWTLKDFKANVTAGAAGLTLTLNGGSSRTIFFTGNFEVGGSTNSQTTTVTAATNDPIIDVDGNFITATNAGTVRGIYVASDVSQLRVAGNMTNDGTFTHSNGTVVVDGPGGTTSQIGGTVGFTGASSLYTLSTTVANKTVQFKASATTTIAGNITATGGSCSVATMVKLGSTAAAAATVNVTGTQSFTYVQPSYIAANTWTLSKSSDGGNNTGMTVSACVTISGTVYENEANTTWTGCDEIAETPTIKISINGAAPQSTTCNMGTYSFTANIDFASADLPVVVYIDGHADNAAKFFRNANTTSNLTVNLYKGHYSLRIGSATAITNAAIDLCDGNSGCGGSGEPGDLPSVSGGAFDASTWELEVMASVTYAPGGDVSVLKLDVLGTYTGGSELVTILGSGGDYDLPDGCSAAAGPQPPLCVDADDGGRFNPNSNTVKFTGSSTSFLEAGAATYNNLILQPASAGAPPTFYLCQMWGADAEINGDLTIGDAAGTYPVNLSLDYCNCANDIIGINNLNVNTNSTLTSTAGGFSGKMVIRDDFTGAGDVSVQDLVIAHTTNATGKKFGPSGAQAWNIGGATFTTSMGAGTNEVELLDGTIGAGALTFSGAVTVGDAANAVNTKLREDLNNVGIIARDLTISSKGILDTGTTVTNDIGRNFTNDGTLNSNGAPIDFTGVSYNSNTGGNVISTVSASVTTEFDDFIVDQPKSIVIDNNNIIQISATGTLTLTGGGCTSGAQVQISSTVPGDQADLNVLGAAVINGVKVTDINSTTAPAPTSISLAVGANTNWNLNDDPCTVAISGNAYDNEAGAAWVPCDNTEANVKVVILQADGQKASATASCDNASGAYTAAAIPFTSSDPIVVSYLKDAQDGDQGATYSTHVYGSAQSKPITQDHVTIPSGSNAITNSDFNTWDSTDDADVPVTGGATLITPSTIELLVQAQYSPEGNVSVGSLDFNQNLSPSAGVTITLTASGTNTTCAGNGAGVQIPLCARGNIASEIGASIAQNLNFSFTGAGSSTVSFPCCFDGNTTLIHLGKMTFANGSFEIAGGYGIEFSGGLEVSSGSVTANVPLYVGPNCLLDSNNFADVSYCNAPPYDLLVNGTLTANTNVVAYGNVTGTGVINQTAGTFTKYTGTVATRMTPGNDWTVNNLSFLCGFTDSSIINVTGASGNRITVNGNLTIGNGATGTTVNADDFNDGTNTGYNDGFDVKGSLTVAANSTFKAPEHLWLSDDFTNNGTFTPGTNQLHLQDTAKNSSFNYTANTSFYRVDSNNTGLGGKTVEFDTDQTTTVTNTFTIIGSSCDSRLNINSTDGTATPSLVLTGATVTATHVAINNVPVDTAQTANGSTVTGTTTNWTAPANCISITGLASDLNTGVTGFDGWNSCDGSTKNLALSYNGGPKMTTHCTLSPGTPTEDGRYTFNLYVSVADVPFVVFMDTNGGDKGVFYQRIASVANLSIGTQLSKNRIALRTWTATAQSNAAIDSYDYDQDTDIPVQVTGSNLAQVGVASIQVGNDYTPGGNITIASLSIQGASTDFALGSNTLTLTGSGVGDCTSPTYLRHAADGGTPDQTRAPLTNCTVGATITDTGTIKFTGTDTVSIWARNYNNLELKPSGAGSPTYSLCYGATSQNSAVHMALGDGTNPVTVSTTTCSTYGLLATGNIGGNSVVVNAGATLSGSASGTLEIREGFGGAGTVNLTDGTVDMRRSGAGTSRIGPTAANDWTLKNLTVSSAAASGTIETSTGGGAVTVTGTLAVGKTADTNPTTLDATTNDQEIDVNGSLDITSKGVLSASNTGIFSVADDFTNNGTFTANGGTVTFDDNTKTSTLLYSAGTSFANFTSTASGKTMRFDDVDDTTITGTMTITGGGCDPNLINLYSATDGQQYGIAITTAAITNVALKDSLVSTATSVTGGIDDGNNGPNWTINGSKCVTVSGNVYDDEGGGPSPWDGCALGYTIAISANGAAPTEVTCDSGTGAFTATRGVAMAGNDQVVAVWMNNAAGNKGPLYTRNVNQTSSITGLVLTQNRVRMRSETATALTNAALNICDADSGCGASGDSDILVTSDGSAITIPATAELLIESGETFAPGGNLSTGALDIQGTLTTGANTYTISGTGGTSATCTETIANQQPVCGTYNPGSSTIRYSGTGSVHVPALAYGTVEFMPASGNPTYELRTGLTAATMTVGNGTDAVSVMASTTYNPNVTVSGNAVVAANATLGGNGTGTFTVNGDTSGAGTISFAAGTFEQRVAAAQSFGTTSGSNAWFFNNLTFSNSSGVDRVITLAIGGSGAAVVTGTLKTGIATDTNLTTLNADTNDRILDINGSVDITTKGVLSASSSAAFTIADDFTRNGTFTHNSGTVVFDDNSKTSTLTYASATSFGALSVLSGGKTMQFDNVDQTNVTGALTVTGNSCQDKVNLNSDSAGVRFELNATGTVAVTYTSIQDSAAIAALAATVSSSGGNNTGWTISGCITVSGNAYANETGTTWAGCTFSWNIAVSVNGGAKQTTACNGDGTFSITNVAVPTADTVVVVFIDPAAGSNRGATYTRNSNSSSDITGLSITVNHTRIRSESATAMSVSAIDTYDYDQDDSIPSQYSGGQLLNPVTNEIYVESGETFYVNDTMTATSLDIRGTQTADGDVVQYLSGSGTGACTGEPNVQTPICVSGGTYNAGQGLVLQGSSAVNVPPLTYSILSIIPTSGNPTYQLGTAGSQTLTIGALVVGAGSGEAVTVSTSTYSPTINITSGAQINSGGVVSGSGTGTITTGDIYGAGTINLSGGTVDATGYVGTTSGSNNWTFNNLTFSNIGGSNRVSTLPAGGVGSTIVNGTLKVGVAANAFTTTLNATTNDRIIDVNGSVDITTKGLISASDSAAFTIADDFTNNGTFTANGGTVTLDSATTATLAYSVDTTFYNLRIATPSKTVQFDEAQKTTITGTTGANPGFTVDGAACNTLVILESVVAANQADLDVTGSSSISYARVKDSNAITALTAAVSESAGNNSGWTIGSGACATFAVLVTAGDPASISPSPIPAGSDGSAQSTINVQTNNAAGYALSVTDGSDTAGLSRAGGGTIDDWTGTNLAPSLWSEGVNGTNGYFGITVLSATGGRLAKWGAGTGETDWAANKYFGILNTSGNTLHSVSSALYNTNHDIVVGYRMNADSSNYAGAYTSTITFTAAPIL